MTIPVPIPDEEKTALQKRAKIKNLSFMSIQLSEIHESLGVNILGIRWVRLKTLEKTFL